MATGLPSFESVVKKNNKNQLPTYESVVKKSTTIPTYEGSVKKSNQLPTLESVVNKPTQPQSKYTGIDQQLADLGVNPETFTGDKKFAVEHPTFTKIMNTISKPTRTYLNDTTGGQFVSRFGDTGADMLTLGTNSQIKKASNPNYQKPTTGSKALDTTADILGGLGGLFTGGGGGLANPSGMNNLISGSYKTGGKLGGLGFNKATQNVNTTKLGESVLKPLGKYGNKIDPTKAGQTTLNLGKRASTGAGAGLTYGALDQLGKDKTLGEATKDTLKEAALFGLGDAGLAAIGKGVKGIKSNKSIQPETNKTELDTFLTRLNKNEQPTRDFSLTPKTKRTEFDNFMTKLNKEEKPSTEFNLKSTNKNTNMPKLEEIKFNKEVATTKESTNLVESFRGKVDRTPKKEKRSFSQTINKLRTQFEDDVLPLAKAEEGIRGKLSSAEDSLYKQARLYKGAPTKANEIIRTRLTPTIKNIENTVNPNTNKNYTYQDLGDYALAIHAKDVNAKGIKSGFTDDEINAVIKEYGTPEMENARKELLALNDELLQELVDTQVISKELFTTLKKEHPNYMPLFRSFDDDKVEFTEGLSKALVNASSPIKRLKGSDKKVIDPIESMVKNVFQTVNAAEKNKVGLQLSKLSKEDLKNEFIRKIGKDENTARKNVVTVLENGEKVKYEVEPELYRSLTNLDKESSNLLVKLLQKPASVLRAGATLTPEFSLRNPIRDINQAYVVSNSGFNPVKDFPVALIDVISKGKGIKIGGKQLVNPSEIYSDWLKNGGGYGNIISLDRKVHREALESALKQPASKKFTNVVTGKSFVSLLRAVADASESATKLGEYRAALRSGASKQEAAYRSRDIMDFNRAGYSTREVNKMVAFFNANIQGKSKLLRAIKEDPKGVTSRAFRSVTLPTIGVYVSQKTLSNDTQKEIINDAPDWLKNSFWLIPIPGTDQVARIPKPFDLAAVFANTPERIMEYIFENDKNAFDGFVRQSLSDASVPVMLTGLTPFIEGMANYSFFRDSPIIPQREQNLNYPDQYDINTSETAKLIAKGINEFTQGEGMLKNFGSPRVVDNTIQGLTAGLGEYGVTAIDALIKGLSDEEYAEKPSKSVDQYPLAGSFLVNQSGTGESMNKLYELRDELRREKGSSELNKTKFEDQKKLNYIETQLDKISSINKQMRNIQNNPNMSGEEKKKYLDRLNKERNDIARKAYDKVGD